MSDADFRPFPLERIPEPARSFIREGALAINCDPCLVALPLLSTLAAAVGNTRVVRLTPRGSDAHAWVEPCALWTAVVAESGSRKSPAMNAAVKMANDADAELGREYDERMREFEREKLGYESKVEAWKKARRSKSTDPDEATPESPKEPPKLALVVKDATIEALVSRLQDNPRGLLVAVDELGGLIASFDRYAKSGGGGDMQKWIECYGKGDLKIDRKTGTPPTIRVRNALVSITGGIQPGILRRLMGRSHRDSGFAARFLMAMPPRRPRRWTDHSVSEQTWAAMQHAYRRLREIRFAEMSPEPKARALGLGEGALDEFIDFMENRNGEALNSSEGDRNAAYSKIEAAGARLALLFALLRWAGGSEPRDPDSVDAESMRDACALADWFRAEADRVYAIFEGDGEDGGTVDGARDRVLAFLRRNGPSTERDIRTKAGGFQRREGLLERTLHELWEEHLADPSRGITKSHRRPSGHGGRPTLEYAIPSSPCSCANCENRRSGVLDAPRARAMADACGYREDCGELIEAWRKSTTDARIEQAARTLGVSAGALRALGFAWCPERSGAYAFPMHDETGRVCGVRLRAPVDSGAAKWALKGSRSGVFLSTETGGRRADRVFVCEGPTDAAALLGVRDPEAPERAPVVIGRASCDAQAELVESLARSMASADAELVIVADRDGAGVMGARALAEHLADRFGRVRTVTPPEGFKDARAWLRACGEDEGWRWLSGASAESKSAPDEDECQF